MSYSSEQTRERILQCAEQEFLEFGYQKANLRKIAENAKATTGALYTHFKNKEELFEALVGQPAEELIADFKKLHERAEVLSADNTYSQKEKEAAGGTDWMLEYIYSHFNVFKLIICCSEGTAYAQYVDRLIEIEENAIRRALPKEAVGNVDDFFIHVICGAGFHELFEAVRHDLPREEALAYIARIKQFRFGGWREILGP